MIIVERITGCHLNTLKRLWLNSLQLEMSDFLGCLEKKERKKKHLAEKHSVIEWQQKNIIFKIHLPIIHPSIIHPASVHPSKPMHL